MTLSLFSPAKLNLFLRILGRRSDGFHNLASLFQTVDLGDTITLALSDKDILTCTDPHLSCDASNLIIKAASLFRQKTGLKFHFKAHLEKQIPMQAGLGGGSSNAATTLWGLNALHGHLASEKELQTWSAEIGSDVPFFFSLGTAYCEGRGEIVQNLPELPFLKSFTLVKPKEGLSTPQIFKELNLKECSKLDPTKILASFFTKNPIFVNDLQHPAFRLLPNLTKLVYKLSSENKVVMMTGSGTAFFCDVVNQLNKEEFFLAKVHFLRRNAASWYEKSYSTK